jgi:hypothetical protein
MALVEQFAASLTEADAGAAGDVRAYLDWLDEQQLAGIAPRRYARSARRPGPGHTAIGVIGRPGARPAAQPDDITFMILSRDTAAPN